MHVPVVSITVTELQTALRDYMENHAPSQPDTVIVDNGFDKIVLTVPLTPGATIRGESFQRATEED
jgi:hypothetical protein